jgi:hypothetical protein
MDEITEQLALFAEPAINPDSLRLDRARADMLDALDGLRLQPDETRVMVWALRMWDSDTLAALASVLFKARSADR